MNLVLFEPEELEHPLPLSDRRVRHVQEVLRRRPGEPFDAGIVQQGRGKAILDGPAADQVRVHYTPGPPLPPRPPLQVIIGLARPQTARDVLRDATTLGATALRFVFTERSDRNYALSTLWSGDEWRRHVIAGASQAFDPRIPDVSWGGSLADPAAGGTPGACAWALDPYEATVALGGQVVERTQPVVLAIGPERGWSTADRTVLRAQGFALATLDLPVLRQETAVVAALTLVAAARARA